MSRSTINQITDTQRAQARAVVEHDALAEATQAMRESGWEAAHEVLAAYAPAYDRLAPIEHAETGPFTSVTEADVFPGDTREVEGLMKIHEAIEGLDNHPHDEH